MHQLTLNNIPSHRDTGWRPYPLPPDISSTGFHVGTSGYHFDDWIGRFNPPKATKRQMAELPENQREDHDRLRFYQKYFSFVEINNTFYREPMIGNFVDIERRSKPSMQYAVKMHRSISHTKTWDIETGKQLVHDHVTAVSPLVETGRFFSFLLQLEDRVVRSQKRLEYLLAVSSEAIREGLDVHIEFRHISWHEMHPIQALKDSGIGICNTEIPPVRHAFPLKAYATSDKGYVRYSGRNELNWYPEGEQKTSKERTAARNARYDYLYSEDEVRKRATAQLELGLKTSSVAIAWNNHYNTQAVQNALFNIDLLQKQLEISLTDNVTSS
jgi:uncharacterized protein YecE (DUF72 family)